MKRKILSLLLALCLVVGMVPMAASAAENEVTTPDQFKNVLTNLSEDTVIKLGSDISVDTIPSLSSNVDVTIDLNNHLLTISTETTIEIKNEAALTIKNGTIKALSFTSGSKALFHIFKKSSIILESVDLDTNGTGLYPEGNAASVSVVNSKINAGVYAVGTNAGSKNNYGVNISLKNSSFSCTHGDSASTYGETKGDQMDSCVIMLNVPGTLTMDTCTVSGNRTGVFVRAGTATIKNSKLSLSGSFRPNETQSGYNQGTSDWGSGSEVPMGALVVGSRNGTYGGDAVCTVIGTKVISQNESVNAVYVSSNKQAWNWSDETESQRFSANLVLKDNTTVQGDVVIADGYEEARSSVTITNVTVNGVVDNRTSYSAAELQSSTVKAVVVSDQADPEITIGENVTFTNPDSNSFEAAVNGKTYETFEAAIDAANQESAVPVVVELLKDVTLDVPEGIGAGQGAVNLQKNMTIEGNDHTITAGTGYIGASNGYHMINIDSGANVIIENLKVDGDHASESSTKPRSGINVYTARATTPLTTVKLNNVTVTNCSTYGVTSNGSIVTATNLNTSGNGWGGVNVDNMNGAASGGSLTINSGTIQSVVIENTSCASDGQNVTIEGGTFTGDVKLQNSAGNTVSTLDGVALKVSGGTFSNQATRDYLEKNGFLAEGMEFDSNGKVVEEQPSTPVTPSTPTYANTVSDTENGKVTASPTRPKEGATVTITTTPDKGYEVGSVSVTDADGKAVAVTNAGNGKYTFKQPDSKVTIKVTFVWDNPFADVADNAWYRNAIQYVYENNLMAGTGDTTFDPEVSLTRAMTAQILYNLDGQPKVDEEATFSDMTEAPTWSVDAIAWAQDTGVVAGMGDNEFAPNAKVTREQFAQMMYNYAKYKKYDLTKTGDLSKFPDDGSVSDWAESALSWANGNGLINGHAESGLLDPQGNTIRGQAASIIMNFDKNVVK